MSDLINGHLALYWRKIISTVVDIKIKNNKIYNFYYCRYEVNSCIF